MLLPVLFSIIKQHAYEHTRTLRVTYYLLINYVVASFETFASLLLFYESVVHGAPPCGVPLLPKISNSVCF